MAEKILFLEDEQTIGEVTTEYMSMQGYDVTWITNGDEAKQHFDTGDFDLAVLDIMVPGMSGLELLAHIQSAPKQLPVIMLSALGDETTQVQAFNLFADDYIIKPFSPLLLLKRIAALLRRSQHIAPSIPIATPNALHIDADTYQVYYNNQSLQLTVTEFLLLQILFENQKQVFTREQLLDQLFADDYYPNDRIVDAHVKNLRKKLPGKYIKTVIGIGYQYYDEN